MIDAEKITAGLEGVSLHLSHPVTGHVVVRMLRVESEYRGSGLAHKVMSRLVAEADAQGVTLALSPEPVQGDTKTRKTLLTAFYRSYGFVPNKGRAKDYEITETMFRQPR